MHFLSRKNTSNLKFSRNTKIFGKTLICWCNYLTKKVRGNTPKTLTLTFKGRKKKELRNEIDELKSQIRDMKDYLPRIVQKIGYRSVQEFLKDFKASQTEYSQYRTAIEKWKKETGKEPVAHGIRAKLIEKKQEIQNEQKNKQHTRSQNKDRGAR